MTTHLSGNVTSLVPIWKMVAADSTVAAYCAHTRNLTFGGTNYVASAVEPTRFSQTLGVLESNHVELFGTFDATITESDVQGGRWRNAKVTYEFIVYDLDTGAASATVTDSVGKIRGQAGKFSIANGTYRVEVRSLSDLLQQDIGELTSGLDRNRTPEELNVSMGPFTHARAVVSSVDRRNFVVNGTAQINDYFKYGRCTFTSGANSGQSMEIKSNTGNTIELQLPVRSTIAASDAVTLYAGYNSTIDQARDKFAAAINFNGEPFLPGIRSILIYPE
jgi:uncharacterized phage protein (TIGR02218 family)